LKVWAEYREGFRLPGAWPKRGERLVAKERIGTKSLVRRYINHYEAILRGRTPSEVLQALQTVVVFPE